MQPTVDVVIVGAGFSGLIAARELTLRGRSVAILEARDRIGGRTWTDERLGVSLEIGGAFVHWSEPYIWSEITRYGLEIEAAPAPWVIHTLIDGTVKDIDVREFYGLLDEPNRRLLDPATTYFPYPYHVTANPEVHEIESITLDEKIAELDLPADQNLVLRAWWGGFASAPLTDAGYAWALQFAALGGGNWEHLNDTLSATIVGGTKALVERIAADTTAEIRLNTVVSAIEQGDEAVTVTTASGETVTAHDVIVSVPLNVVSAISFTPELDARKQRAVAEGQASRGTKIWALLRGRYRPFVAFGDEASKVTAWQFDRDIDGNTLILGFGQDAATLDPEDRDAVEAELRRWFPDAAVLAVTSHNWTTDPYSRGTWSVARPGQTTAVRESFREPECHVHFAGGDYAPGFSGSMDGAVETGLRAARRTLSAQV